MATYCELENSPTFTLSQTDFRARRMFKVPWADLESFYEEMLGVPGFVAGNRPNFVSPATFPGKDWLEVDTIDVSPFDPGNVGPVDADGVATYPSSGAKVTVSYKPKEYDTNEQSPNDTPPEGVDFYSHEAHASSEYVTLPVGQLRWFSDDSRVPEEIRPGTIVPVMNHVVTWYYVPRPPWTAINQQLGTVNNGSFWGWPWHTALFSDAKIIRTNQTWHGERLFEISYTFSVKWFDAGRGYSNQFAGGWNHALRQDTGEWDEVTRVDENGGFIGWLYETSDFNNLFKMETLELTTGNEFDLDNGIAQVVTS